jgi:hypothetical protein
MGEMRLLNVGSAPGRVYLWVKDDDQQRERCISLDREEALNLARAILDVTVVPPGTGT